MSVLGLAQALKALDNLGQTVKNKIARKAIAEASRPIKAAAKAMANRETSLLAQAQETKVKSYRQGGTTVSLTGAQTGTSGRGPNKKLNRIGKKAAALGRKPSKYSHLVDRGHNIVRNGKTYGFVPGSKYLERAFESAKSQAVAIMARRVGEELRKL